MTLKECSLKILGFTWGFLVTFKDQRDQDGSQVHRDEERYGGKRPFEMAIGQSRDLILAAEFHR